MVDFYKNLDPLLYLKMPDDLFKEEDPYDHFELLQQLGQGSYGTVQQVFSVDTSEIAAAKIIGISDDQDYKAVLKEVKFLKLLSETPNPNVVNYIDSYYSKAKGELWIITEFCGGGAIKDLMVDANRVLDERECAYVMKHVLLGLKYLKEKRILHRDIKGGNILITEEGGVKLADFGVSAQLGQTFNKQQSAIGTPYYMAPEVFAKSQYAYEADVWSTGITAVELLEGKPPYSNLHPMRAMILIPQSPPYSLEGRKSPLTNKEFSADCCDFVAKCLIKEQEKRYTVEQLLEHPFLQKAGDLQSLIAHRYEGSVADSESRNSLDIGDVVRKSMEIENAAASVNPQFNSIVRTDVAISIQNYNTAVKQDIEKETENIDENAIQNQQYNTVVAAKEHVVEIKEEEQVTEEEQPQQQEQIKKADKPLKGERNKAKAEKKKKGGCNGQ